MNRTFLLNIAFLIFVNIIVKPFYIFGIDRGVQNLVGEQQYGIYYTLFCFAFLFQSLNDLGIQNFSSLVIAGNEHLLEKYFSHILVLKSLFAGVYLVITFITALLLGYDHAWLPMLFGLCLNNILLALVNYLRSNLSSVGMYLTGSFLTVLDKLLMIGFGAALLWTEPFKLKFNIAWYIHAQNLTLLMAAAVGFTLTFRRLQRFRLRFNRAFLWHILRGSLPFALAFFLMTVYTRADVILLERLLPDGIRQAGIYASAYRLIDAGNVLGFFFSTLLLPMFAKQLKQKEDVTPLLRLSFQLIYAVALSIALHVFLYRQPIMHALYHEATSYSGDVLGILIFSFVGVSINYIYGSLLSANGNMTQLNRLFLLTIPFNLILNIFLIRYYQAIGAAMATALTQFFVVIGQMILSKRLLQLRGGISWIFRLFLFAVLTFTVAWFCQQYFQTDNWWVAMLVSMAFSGIIALALGFKNYG